MGAYVPAHKRQLTGSPLGPLNCNMAAAAMMADAATLGLVNVTADAMRKASGDTTGGTNIHAAATALAYYGIDVIVYDASDGLTWTDVVWRIGHDRPLIAHGDYDQVPTPLRGDKSFVGLHSVLFDHIPAAGRILVGDGLNDGRHAGVPKGIIEWPASVADAYMAKFPGGPYTAAVMRHTTARVRIARANVRSGPGTSHGVITTRKRGATFRASCRPDIGQSVGGDRRWYRVWLTSRNRVGYVHASVVSVTTTL